MIRRKKLTVFTDAKDTTTVLELKKIIEGSFILKIFQNNILTFVVIQVFLKYLHIISNCITKIML